MADIYFIIIPIVVVVVVLKLCLIFWRIWLYQKRREQARACNERFSSRATARVVAVRRLSGPGGIAQQTSYAIEQPGQPTRQVTRTVIVRPNGRPNDPNLPPSYDQAITGADRSVKVEDTSGLARPNNYVTPSAPAPPVPEVYLGPPHMPPSNRNRPHLSPPPAYDFPRTVSRRESEEVPASERERLLP